eukprot:CAMPEP_0197519932 /NCGR_PEP_ID=MMETSP1318-20131121/5226_1 /TAXON_ID=552666 /ORGANISM="Partenskyella glossopodia, Strain RCC365" /LENGTH=102 /DNA_ID=CAMNT_0043071195 /DNA_START=80 /DNA_END=388 /DNA_ORIENTATION=+
MPDSSTYQSLIRGRTKIQPEDKRKKEPRGTVTEARNLARLLGNIDHEDIDFEEIDHEDGNGLETWSILKENKYSRALNETYDVNKPLGVSQNALHDSEKDNA